jgi:hypothetical protein
MASDHEREHAAAYLRGIIQATSRRLQGLELQASGIGQPTQATIAASIKANKAQLAQLQEQINTIPQSEAEELARALAAAVDELEQRLQTVILAEWNATRIARNAALPQSTLAPQRRSLLLAAALFGVFLVFAAVLALTAGGERDAQQELFSAQGSQEPITPAQLLQAAESPPPPTAAQLLQPLGSPTSPATATNAQTRQNLGPAAAQATAIARPVWLQVNRSLLQATIIDAMRSVEGMEPATATVLQIQYEGNIATIEALRPTADALNIVLWQQPVQPTDAAEATLFAQADAAARSPRYPGETPAADAPQISPTPTIQ